ncbi:hypothetical protein LINGRAHAP2_LOCUS31793 [Linum grandiflorum]
MFSCSLTPPLPFLLLLARIRAICVIARALRRLVNFYHGTGCCLLYTRSVKGIELRTFWLTMVILLGLVFILFLPSYVR